jgi:hypothetical protein
VLKDTAVYNAMIAALQLAAQRKLFDEADMAQGGGRQLSTSSDPPGDVTSEQLFEFAQIIYAEGLADGQLQQFAYSASFTARQRENADGVSVEPLVGKDSKKRESRRSKVEGAVPTVSPIDTLKQNCLMSEDNSVISKKDRTEICIEHDLEEPPRQGSVVGRRWERKSVTMQGKSTATSITRTAASISTSTPDRSAIASMTSPISRAGTPRVLDLHRCPLLVAKTAVDYELKQIHDMLSSSPHDTSLGDRDLAFSGSRKEEGEGDVSAMRSTFSRLNRRQPSSALEIEIEIGSREGSANSGSGGGLSSREERRSHRSNRLNKKTTATLSDDVAALDRSDSPRPSAQVASGIEDLIANRSAEDETGPKIRSSARFQECGRDLHIITGRGRHVNSSGTRGVLRSAMKDYLLEKYNIAADSMLGNDGCLVISRRSIDAWIRRVSAS